MASVSQHVARSVLAGRRDKPGMPSGHANVWQPQTSSRKLHTKVIYIVL